MLAVPRALAGNAPRPHPPTSRSGLRRLLRAGCLALGGITLASLLAFPPTPHHEVSGMVRNEMGEPLNVTNATVILETLAGTQVKTAVVPNLGPGRNYRLKAPMDAGITTDNYRANALRAAVSFRMKVKVGTVTYLPLETATSPATLGRPAEATRLDLTLGADLDGDGLPDAWERALIAMLGLEAGLPDIRPGDDADGDGISNASEYAAGTYPFDPADGFRLDVVGTSQDRMVLEFVAIPGRRYVLHASADLQSWNPVAFRLPEDAATAAPRTDFVATTVRILRVEAEAGAVPGAVFFKAQVQ